MDNTNEDIVEFKGTLKIKTSTKLSRYKSIIVLTREYIFLHGNDNAVWYIDKRTHTIHSASWGAFTNYVRGRDLKQEVIEFKNK